MSTSAIREGAYWKSSVSAVNDRKVFIRGYDLEDLIGELSFTAAIYLLVRGRVATPQEARVLDAVLSAVLDFGLEKPGTVAARYAVSANPNMAVGMAAACMSVGKNTLATEDTGHFIAECHRAYRESELSIDDFADQTVQQLRLTKQRIPGLGHPVYKKIDPRAAILKNIAVDEGVWTEAAEVYEAIHRAFTRLPGKSDIPINDVGVMAAVLAGLGFTPEEGTGIAILSTMPGVVAHVSEELASQTPIRIVARELVDYDVTPGQNFKEDRRAAGWSDSFASHSGVVPPSSTLR